MRLLQGRVVTAGLDLVDYLARQVEWSRRTFGGGRRTLGLITHIDSELAEIAADPTDLTEWVDVIILALEGAWRSGHTPEEVAMALQAKQERNFRRSWPPPPPEDQPSFHVAEAVEFSGTVESS